MANRFYVAHYSAVKPTDFVVSECEFLGHDYVLTGEEFHDGYLSSTLPNGELGEIQQWCAENGVTCAPLITCDYWADIRFFHVPVDDGPEAVLFKLRWM